MFHKTHHIRLLKRQIIDQKSKNKQIWYLVVMDMVNGNILITQMLKFQLITAGMEEAEIMEAGEDLQDQIIMKTMQIIHLILIIVLF
jgi:hypothetical protein